MYLNMSLILANMKNVLDWTLTWYVFKYDALMEEMGGDDDWTLTWYVFKYVCTSSYCMLSSIEL